MPRRRKSRTGKEMGRLMASRADLAAVFLSPAQVKSDANAYFKGKVASPGGNIVACLMEFVMHDDDRHLASEATQMTTDPMRMLSLFPEGGGSPKVLQWYHNDRCYAIYQDGHVKASSGDPRWVSPQTEETLQQVVDLYLLRKWASVTYRLARAWTKADPDDPATRMTHRDLALEWEHDGGNRPPTRLYNCWQVPIVLAPRQRG